jgi:hypothetical protein
MRSIVFGSIALASFALAACRGDEGSTSSTTADAGAAFYNSTFVKCPFPTSPKGFATDDAKNILDTGKLSMNEDQDAYGLPGSLPDLKGKMQRGVSNYVVGKVFATENVSLWVQNASGAWEQSGATIKTDDNGNYTFPLPQLLQAKNTATHVYALLEGDGTCAEHGVYAWPKGSQVVVWDIDGTITKSNAEFQTQVTQPSYVPLEHPSATATVEAWSKKGYRIVFLSARPDNFRDASRVWFVNKGVDIGPIITSTTFVTGAAAVAYKSTYLKKIVQDFGWTVVAAYGNEPSDVQAYEAANVPKAQTFTVETANGTGGTQGIANDDYGPHITNYVDKQPDATQP